MKKDYLENAIQLDWGITLYKDYAKYIVSIIYDHVFDDGKNNKKRRRVLIKVIANLRKAYDKDVPLRYSKSKDSYKNLNRNFKIGYDVVKSVMDSLLEKDMIDQSSFFYNRDNSVRWNRQTRIWTTKNLIGIFEPIHPEDVVKEPPQFIQLRERLTKKEKQSGKIAKQLDYSLTKESLLMEKQIVEYHNLLEQNDIRLVIPEGTILKQKSVDFIENVILKEQLYSVWGKSDKNNKIVYNIYDSIYHRYRYSNNTYKSIGDKTYITNTRVFFVTMCYNWIIRVFSETFDLGGRYYDSAWSGMPSELRKCLQINFEPVCEPDYSGQHIRMLYHLDGLDYRDDVYACGDAPRDLYKTAFLVLVNSKSDNHYAAVKEGFRKKKLHFKGYPDCLYKDTIMSIIDDIFRTHSKINHHFFSDKGIELQNIDSQITSDILDYFIKKRIVCLPVHDSYIVQERHREELVNVMTEKYKNRLGFEPVIC